MSSLIDQLARAKKELAALKAGFAGDEKRFTQATTTVQQFTLTVTKPLTITVDFDQPDFPQLFVSTYNNTTATDYGSNLFDRKDLYEWRMGLGIAANNYTFTCLLLSENAPTLFTLVQDP